MLLKQSVHCIEETTAENVSSVATPGDPGADVKSKLSDTDDDDEHKAHLQWRLEEVRVIKYGSLRRLVAALSSETGQMEVTNVNTFLTTCRTFASTTDVVEELIARCVRACGRDFQVRDAW